MQSYPMLFIGDSLTEWFDLPKYFPDARIINEGIAGDTTYGVLERLDQLIDMQVEKIFLMIGINDIFNGFDKYDIIENQQLIIETIQTHANSSALIVQSLLPVNERMLGSNGNLNKTISFINAKLKEQCDARKVMFLNLHPYFLSGNDMRREFTTDGGHLSDAGYQLWAKKIQVLLK
jgi:lysophospholipase L1-like esterase